MLLPLKDMAGKQLGDIEVSDAVFAAPVRTTLMHQALVRQLANKRAGTHKVKTRGEVRGGGRKPWRQKGTGRARQGSTRSPNWVGGGTVFGPTPRSYAKSMPRKMRRAALRSALSVKAANGQIMVVDSVAMDAPRTKEMVKSLTALGVDGQSVLMVIAEKNVNFQKSANNLPTVKTLLGGYLNVRDLLGYDQVIIAKDAIEQIDSWLATESVADLAQETAEE
ncbi:MAG: 50S ribosomal protein L4 [Caldilineaceae bacterium]|nr:50S ribosomal protein L4 [Caldilineaceae bacterium]